MDLLINLTEGTTAGSPWLDLLPTQVTLVAVPKPDTTDSAWSVAYDNGASFALPNDGSTDGVSPTSGDASWVNDAAATNTHRLTAGEATFHRLLISGPVSTAFDAELFASHTSVDASVNANLNGGTAQTLAQLNNTTNTITFSGTTDGSGNAYLEYAKLDGFAYPAAIRLIVPDGADTTAPTFTSAPAVTATTSTGHTISSTLDETGTIYGVRLADGAAAPSSAQVKAGQDSAGSAAPEATSVAATAATNADLVFSTGSASTPYDYYIVAEDDEGTPNIQASPTLVNATTAAAEVEGLPVYTLNKDGSALGNLTGIKVRVTATGELDGTEYYSANNLTATAGVMDSTIDLSATAASVGDTVTVEILTTANEGIVFTDLVEDIA